MFMNLAPQLEQCLPTEVYRLVVAAGQIGQEQKRPVCIVGGVVRDMLLGRTSFDLDLMVEGNAVKLAELLAQREGGAVTAHSRFGTAKVRCRDVTFDLAMARAETYSYPGALPTVCQGTIDEDLRRRDFTINAMAIRLDGDRFGELVDPCGGQSDLEKHLVRVIHGNSFIDDATRILRGIRYEQRLGFKLELTTEALLRRDLEMLGTISNDRIRHEIELILREEFPENVLRRADGLGVLGKIHPLLKGNGWLQERFQRARNVVQPPPLTVYLSLWIYHLSSGECGDFASYFKFPQTVVQAIQDTTRLRENLAVLAQPGLSPSTVYEFLKGYSSSSILACAVACDTTCVSDYLHLYLDKLCHVRTSLNGRMLQQMGIPPGERLGEVLRALHRAKLDGQVMTRSDEEELVLSLLGDLPGG